MSRSGMKPIFGFDQQLAIGAYQNRAEGMISMFVRPPRHVEGFAQKALVIEPTPGCHR